MIRLVVYIILPLLLQVLLTTYTGHMSVGAVYLWAVVNGTIRRVDRWEAWGFVCFQTLALLAETLFPQP